MGEEFRTGILLRLQGEVLQAMARRDDLVDVLDALCHLVEEAVGPGICSVMRYDARLGRLFFTSAPCVPDAARARLDGLEPGELANSCGTAFHTGEIVAVSDTQSDPRWAEMRDFAREAGIQACWSVPIKTGEEVLGTFAISRPKVGGPSDPEMLVLRTAAQMAGIAIDRERAHAELLEQRSLLMSTIEATEDPFFLKDENLRYQLVNSAEAEGVAESPEAMIGKSDEELYPSLAEMRAQADRAILETGEGRVYEEVVDNPLRGRRTYLIRKSPLLDEDGKTKGIVGIARDITARKQNEEALRRTQKLESLGVLAGGIAHDFNNILTGILGNAHLALRSVGSNAEVRECLSEIGTAAHRASDLTNQMLAYAGQGSYSREIVSLPRIVAEVSELLSSSISKRAQLTFDIDESLPGIEAAPSQMRQVLMNVLTNASEALEGRNGEIQVRMRHVDLSTEEAEGFDVVSGSYVLLEVEDSGIGMDTATLERMFDPFFSTKFDGRGLGLAAVQGIVAGHAGGLIVESRPGRGTRVRIVLPTSERRPTESSPETGPAERAPMKVHVLVVEDERSVRDLIRMVLEDDGHDVTICEDGQAALNLIEDGSLFDVVLLDLTTPRLSGPEFVAALDERGTDIPILLTSGYGEHVAMSGFDEGSIAAFLQKPFRPDNLIEKLASVLRSHALRG